MKQIQSLHSINSQVFDLKAKRVSLHDLLIHTKRKMKVDGICKKEIEIATDPIRKDITALNQQIRNLEHSMAILTITLLNEAVVEDTAYGRVIKYQEAPDENL